MLHLFKFFLSYMCDQRWLESSYIYLSNFLKDKQTKKQTK